MIKVYLDTNMLEDYSGNNVIISNKILSEKFYNFIKQVSENASLHSVMTIVIPQVVIDEISNHIKDSFDTIKTLSAKINKIYKELDVDKDIILKRNEDSVLRDFDKEIKSLIDKFPFITIEKHLNTIENIYYKAIKKLPPFYQKKSGDCGFKDAMLWKTAMDNKGVSKNIICSSDDDFKDCGIEIVKSFDELISIIQTEYLSKKELIESFISDDYIKDRIADELGYREFNNINLELLNYFEIDDPQFYDSEVIKIKATIDNQIILAEFNVNMPTNEIELSQLIEDGE